MKYFIYCATSPSNKKYIGITKDFDLRKINHHYRSKFGKTKFVDAIKKHGFENIKWEILFEVNSWLEACTLEQELILKYNTINNGYNMTEGGEGIQGYKHSQETIEKMHKNTNRIHFGSENGMYGKKHSNDTKNKMSSKQKGRVFSKEHKEKLKISRKLQKPPTLGKKWKLKKKRKSRKVD